jgi:hypothetical protein
MASAAVLRNEARRPSDPLAVRIYCWGFTAAFLVCVALVAGANVQGYVAESTELLGWVVLVALADALRVRLWNDFSFSMSMPISLASVLILAPWQAAGVAALASIDVREFRAEVPLARALFNRAEVGLSVLCAALVFHGLGGEGKVARVVVASAGCRSR